MRWNQQLANLTNAYEVIISDLDGCLANESGGPFDLARLGRIAEHNRLAELQKDRPPLTLCTGRPQPFAEAMSRALANQKVPVVAENGVWLYWPATNGYEMDPEIDEAHLMAVSDARQLLRERYAAEGVTQQPAKSASVTLYHPRREHLHNIFDEVRELLALQGWPFRVSMTWDYINCDLAHISKASGLKRFFEATGFDPQRAIGVGDTSSDLPIAEACGWFGCPANACESLHSVADYVSPYEQTEGVLDILQVAKVFSRQQAAI